MRVLATLLFAQKDLSEVLGERIKSMQREVEGVDANRLLNTQIDVLTEYLEKKYSAEPPVLIEGGITADQVDSPIDVSGDPLRPIEDRSRAFYVPGTTFSFFVCFSGEAEFFRCKPSVFGLNPPRAEIRTDELVFTYPRADLNAESVKLKFESDLRKVQDYLEKVVLDSEAHNRSLREIAKALVESRRQKLLRDQAAVAALGYPLRRRTDAPRTYAVPDVRRKILPQMPTARTKPAVLDPTLANEEYESILTIIRRMSLVLERSPKAFKGMKEEDLRNHFLVQLNGQYEGKATGETFNASGKTDILIREKDKNLFIAECKFWNGPESLSEAIDQLLGYATWRDGKLAILLFNRKKKFSTVLSKIPEVAKNHASFKRQVDYESESGFRFHLHHPDDSDRELVLTVLAFEVPG